jgi:hypothetical protein
LRTLTAPPASMENPAPAYRPQYATAGDSSSTLRGHCACCFIFIFPKDKSGYLSFTMLSMNSPKIDSKPTLTC